MEPNSLPAIVLADAGVAARQLAIRALVRIERGGAYANLVLPPMLDRSKLADRDRALVTEMVYGTTRMRRACDYLVDRFLLDEVEPEIRAALRVGAYQVHFLRTPAHAAVGATAGAVKGRGRSVVNAVLRRVAGAGDEAQTFEWPDEATELSYPDWIVAALTKDLGREQARESLLAMNEPATCPCSRRRLHTGPASQMVVEAVGAQPNERVVDLCAAPGGKATALIGSGAQVFASDLRPNRTKLIARNAATLNVTLPTVTGDGRRPPFRPNSFDRVLIDAPCSGLGSLRRRARCSLANRCRCPRPGWPTFSSTSCQPVFDLLTPGGTLTYSVCTLTGAETTGVLAAVRERHPSVELLPVPEGDWQAKGAVGYFLPGDSDGMSIWRVRVA